MFCEKCGNRLPENAKFCNKCGTKVSYDQPEKKVFHGQVQQKEHKEEKVALPEMPSQPQKKFNFKKYSWIFIILFLIGLKGCSYYEDQNNEEAIKINDRIINNLSQYSYADATSQLENALSLAKDDRVKADIYSNLGFINLSEEKGAEALDNFNKALDLYDINTFDYFLMKGEIEYINRDYDKALEYYKKAYNKDPSDFLINNSLAVFYLSLDDESEKYLDVDKAIQHSKRAKEINNNDLTKSNLATAYTLKEEYQKAINLFNQISNMDSDEEYLLGLNYLNIEDFDNAVKFFKKAKDHGAKLEPEFEDFLNNYTNSGIDPVNVADYQEGYKAGYADGRSSYGELGDNYYEPATEERKDAYLLGYLDGFLKGCKEGNFDCSEVETLVNELLGEEETGVDLIPTI